MQQRVRKPHRGCIPSSSGQLPVPVALNAGPSTLFACYHTTKGEKCKYLFGKFLSISLCHPERREGSVLLRLLLEEKLAFARNEQMTDVV